MSEITGRAKKYNGASIDYVSLFNWADGKCIAQVVPNAAGAWSYQYFKNISIGITYVATGCEPITHGPYALSHTPSTKKWWRLNKIKIRGREGVIESTSITFAEISFNPSDGSSMPSVVSAFHSADYEQSPQSYMPINAFDKNITSFSVSSANLFDYNVSPYANYQIGCKLSAEIDVASVSLTMRQDMQPAWGQEVQEADVECSDDGITWIKVGVIKPNIAKMDKSKVTTPIIF